MLYCFSISKGHQNTTGPFPATPKGRQHLCHAQSVVLWGEAVNLMSQITSLWTGNCSLRCRHIHDFMDNTQLTQQLNSLIEQLLCFISLKRSGTLPLTVLFPHRLWECGGHYWWPHLIYIMVYLHYPAMLNLTHIKKMLKSRIYSFP